MTNFKSMLPTALTSVLVMGAATTASAGCDRYVALNAVNSGSYTSLCDCSSVTPSFLRALQRSDDFSNVVSQTARSCPGLSNLLTDPIVESGSGGLEGDDLRPDQEEVERIASDTSDDDEYDDEYDEDYFDEYDDEYDYEFDGEFLQLN